MSLSQAWKQLGIAPCADERAVKRAYAAKLKAIDPDREIDVFSKLRAALAMAQADAQRRAAAQQAGGGGAAVEAMPGAGPDEAEVPARAEREHLPVPAPQPEPEPDPARPFIDVIVANLFPQEGAPADPAALVAAVTSLLADPRMEQFDFATETEEWLATTGLQSIPRSDPVMLMLADRFEWERQLDRAQPNRLLLSAAQRANDLRCIGALSDPLHRWHEAWLALSRAEPVKPVLADTLRLAPAVSELIASLSYNNPQVLRQCDPAVIAHWTEAAKGSVSAEIVPANGVSWFGWLAIGWIVVSVLARIAIASGQ
ncbi:MAG: hypothetical protein P0Y56_15600 [Candidatus Andeanibacterium colombiense]|uniref:J domain-containing protein n=1 Tax=Candidatus Andeanibacterium colombiense TaxID=3121345 RepID=A0AAJ5X6B1_9SPHN|nr:MAG: hypothetical protein P0Y56_15600 [Sphingomonadaceae bacterium]